MLFFHSRAQQLSNPHTLADLGWSAHYLRQLELAELSLPRLRISAVHRNRLTAIGEAGPCDLPLPPHVSTADFAVGDWVLAAPGGQFHRRLDRHTLLHRRAAGTGTEAQLIAANVDTLFITTSCNADFNPRRLERYLALATETGCEPVVILTKSDMAADPATFADQARTLKRGLAALPLDARDPGVAAHLSDWCRKGQTVALLGSSGVGKSTLMNSLSGTTETTAPIREDDARGRHTTTHRALHPMAGGGWIIDTPGMRALRLTDVADGIDALFAEITDLAPHCRFRDCSHHGEPGCAIGAAIEAGSLDPARLARWEKLRREDRFNTETLAQSRARHRAFGRMHKALTDRRSKP